MHTFFKFLDVKTCDFSFTSLKTLQMLMFLKLETKCVAILECILKWAQSHCHDVIEKQSWLIDCCADIV